MVVRVKNFYKSSATSLAKGALLRAHNIYLNEYGLIFEYTGKKYILIISFDGRSAMHYLKLFKERKYRMRPITKETAAHYVSLIEARDIFIQNLRRN